MRGEGGRGRGRGRKEREREREGNSELCDTELKNYFTC